MSGHQNIGFAVNDYRPIYDDETLEPQKIKTTERLRGTKGRRGAF